MSKGVPRPAAADDTHCPPGVPGPTPEPTTGVESTQLNLHFPRNKFAMSQIFDSTFSLEIGKLELKF